MIRTRDFLAASLGLAALVLAACGSSGSGDGTTGGTAPTAQDEAASASVMGACTGASSNAASSGVGTLSYEAAEAQAREGIADFVARTLAQQLSADPPVPEKGVSATQQGDTVSLTFSDVTVTNPSGGSATLSGTLSLSQSQSGSQTTYTISGTLTTVVTDWAATVTVSGTPYGEAVSGTWTMAYSGTITVTSGQGGGVSIDLTATIEGSDITVTGDVSGSASISGLTITISGSGTQASDYSAACSGTVTVTRTGGSSVSCTVSSDCTGCD